MPFEAASKLPVHFSPPLELFDLGDVGVAVQLVPLLRGSRSTVHLLRTLLTTCDINHLTRNLKLKSRQVRSTDWTSYLSLVAFLLNFRRASACLLQEGGELPQLLVAVRQGDQGLLLQLLCLSHPVHTLQPDTQESTPHHVHSQPK